MGSATGRTTAAGEGCGGRVRSDRARRPFAEVNREPVDPLLRRIARGCAWVLRSLTLRDWDDGSRLPPTGPVIVTPNHISNADPPLVAHYLIWSGRWPRFLAKAALWDIPVLGWAARRTGQIPVLRHSGRPGDSLGAAAEALALGRCVVVYPEGTVTRDPEGWPMRGRSGAARLALATGAPVVPLGQWGAGAIMDRWHVTFPRLVPRPLITMRLGEPVDLVDLAPPPGEPPSEAAVQQAGERIMASITALVAGIRGAQPPDRPFDPRADAQPA